MIISFFTRKSRFFYHVLISISLLVRENREVFIAMI
nr:MAG TPA: hypothetical protein [Caudoviricetes sp.]